MARIEPQFRKGDIVFWVDKHGTYGGIVDRKMYCLITQEAEYDNRFNNWAYHLQGITVPGYSHTECSEQWLAKSDDLMPIEDGIITRG